MHVLPENPSKLDFDLLRAEARLRFMQSGSLFSDAEIEQQKRRVESLRAAVKG